MNAIVVDKNPYILDYDINGGLALTEKNVTMIDAILQIDSSYRDSFFSTSDDSSFGYIKRTKISTDEDIILKQITLIDKENSTHLSVSGLNKGDNKGKEITAKYISQINNLEERLKQGDETLVNEISSAVQGRNNFSFASKFCTYMSRYCFDNPYNDNYSIYDQVICNILPYYAWVYLGEIHIGKTSSTISDEFGKQKNYGGYRDLIDRIRESSQKITSYKISRKDFDHILWYYYKGSNVLTKKMNLCVRNEAAKLF